MKKKRTKKPTPHELAAASPFEPLPTKQRKEKREKQPKQPKEKKRKQKRDKRPTPQQQGSAVSTPAPKKRGPVSRVLGAPVRILAKPFAKVARLRGTPRIVVWGLLAIVVVFGALQLRGGRDDDLLVRQALERYEKASSEKDVQSLCDELLASSYVKQTASSGLPCEVALRTALEDVRNPTLDVLSVEVNGDRAAARVRGSAAGQVPGQAVYTLVRENDSWRILPPRPAATTP